MPAIPLLLFVLYCGGVMAWSLRTGRAWHWGTRITRAENPSGYYQFLFGVGLPMIIVLAALSFGWTQ